MRIELFGNLRITCHEQLVVSVNTNRLQSLLAFLLLHGEAPQPREQLAFTLWPESSEPQARTNLRQLIHHLRRALPADCCFLSADNHTVQWRRDPACSVDVAEFDAALERAAGCRARTDAEGEIQALKEGVRLYQDDLLRGSYDEWLLPKREDYRRQFAAALGRLAALLEDRRDYAEAIRHAERLVAFDPLLESHHQILIRLHTANHDRAGALRAYHQCMRVLRRELAVDPAPATRDLYNVALEAAAPANVPAVAPAPQTSSMVGRKREWGRLVECWHLAARAENRLAIILGEPGIGKSRLAEELHDWCARQGATVARARCYAAQGQLAYAPIAEWLRSSPLRAAVAELPQAQLAELARVLPEILTEHPAIQRPGPLTESWERRHLYESLNAVFGKASKPLLLWIDDLQWCDPDSFEWLDSFLRSEASRRTLMLGTVRPEETGRSHPFTRLMTEMQQSGRLLELPLSPLDREESAALSAQIAGHSLNDADLAGLYKATRGNPLFIVESVRAGLGSSDSAAGASPPRIHAVISARFAQLSATAYELTGFAAAIGQPFSIDLLAKATDWDEESLSRSLDELWQRRIVESHGPALYDFSHDRLREVAYAELSPVRQRFLHRRIARALEEMQAGDLEPVYGQLAAHYDNAGMPEQAVRCYVDAAAVARQRYAEAEAAGLLRRALALCRALPESTRRDRQELEVLVILGLSLATTLGYATAEVGETYERALALSLSLRERKHLLPVLSGAWVFQIVRGNVERSREHAQQVLDLAAEEGEPAFAMAGHFVMASSLFHLGRFSESESQIREALAGWKGAPHPALALFAGPDVGMFCRSYLAHILWHLGLGREALAASDHAVATARQISRPFALAIALNYAAMLHVFRREAREAQRWAEEAASVCREHAFAYYLSMAEILAGWSMAQLGDPHGGITRLRQGLDAFHATGAGLRLPFYHALLAEACERAGQIGEGLANISSGFAFLNRNGEAWAAPHLQRIHADLSAANLKVGAKSNRATGHPHS